jgi:hypothetical protein
MIMIEISLNLLFAAAAISVVVVLVNSFHRATAAWGELRHAVETCPEWQHCRVTHFEIVARPAPQPLPLRLVSRPAPVRRSQPALRAAA